MLDEILNEIREVKSILLNKNKVYVNRDTFVDEYLQDENICNILDLETKEVYQTYLESLKLLGINNEFPATIRMFNKKVRQHFPQLEIFHFTRKQKNVYVWRRKDVK